MRKVSLMATCVSALALAACGSGNETSEAGADGATGEVTTAGPGGSPAPSLEEKRALMDAFREGPPAGCADNFVEATDDSEGRELSGTSFVACAGSESSEEPYVLSLITEGNGQIEAGTMEFYMQANSHPLAYEALKDIGRENDVLIVSVDGGCPGVQNIADGVIGATAQQYPLLMASKGIEAIAAFAADGTKPQNTEGKDFFDTGVALVTDEPADGVDSISVAEGTDLCWG